MAKRTGAVVLGLFFLLGSQFSHSIVLANAPITSESIKLLTYLDGYVLVDHEVHLNQTYPSMNVTLLGGDYSKILVLDDQNLPLEYLIVDNKAIIYNIGSTQIKISYFTSDLTFKTGKYWTLRTELFTNATIILPEGSSIISLNKVPELIESSDERITLVMSSGIAEITYIATISLYEEAQGLPIWFFFVTFSLVILATTALFFRYSRRKKLSQQLEVEHVPEVDLVKLFKKERHLRSEEKTVVKFLAEKHGTAFEAELYEKMNLPRTTMWRLIKRLKKMEIIDVKKSRRQNIVSIKRKYMKKQ